MADNPAAILYDSAGQGAVDTPVGTDGKTRLSVDARAHVVPPVAPEGTTPVQIVSDTPLTVTTTQQDEYTIPAGKTFYLQSIVAGAEGDPVESGSKVEAYYYDGATERLLLRLYLLGQTVSVSYADVSETRDGTPMEGNGTSKEIRVRRTRLSGGSAEIDAVVYGYLMDT